MKTKSIFAAAILACFAASSLTTSAAVIVSGDINVAGNTGSLEITEDIDFTITTAGTVNFLVFDEWVLADSTATWVLDANELLSYEINGGPAVLTTSVNAMYDNAQFGALTPNDGAIAFGSIAVAVNDVITIKAQTITFQGNNAFNPDALGTFTGNAFLASTAAPLSSPTSLAPVPEPSAYAACAGLGLLAFAAWRQKLRSGKFAMKQGMASFIQ